SNGGAVQTAVFGSFEGRTMAPDLLVVQEILSQSAVDALVGFLNSAPSSPGDYVAGPFTNGRDTDNGMFYRSSKLVFLGTTILPADPGTSGAPRDVNRYDLQLVGYDAPASVIAIYSWHMKASSSSASQARRLIEAQKIRTDAEGLNPEWNFILGADFNIQSSNQAAYQHLINSQANNNGRFADAINTPGSWNNNFSFRFVHTQDPSGAGGMDDRLDQILFDLDLGAGEGLDYKGAFGLPYSTTTWNDLNHSYRSWGNDGSTFNVSLATTTNAMVGPTIANALKALASGGGHLPVIADLVVPGVIGADGSINLGTIPIGVSVNVPFNVGNDGDTVLWSADGINSITYTLDTDVGFGVDAGSFNDDAGGAMNIHTLNVSAGLVAGPIVGEIRVNSNDIDTPELIIPITGQYGGCSAADLAEPFGTLNLQDVFAYLALFNDSNISADLAEPFGVLNLQDVFAYLATFNAGCPE
ncbi:MAG: hypothetical protein JKY96_02815, partial [Phycisphaerales bacterium]|nr:hypothetical protein [Phycisphaerales bacterium]